MRCRDHEVHIGFPYNKLEEFGTLDAAETLACRLRLQAVTDVVLERLEMDYGLTSASPPISSR